MSNMLMIELEERVYRLEKLVEHRKKERLAIHLLTPHGLAVRTDGEDAELDENFWIFELIDSRRNADEALISAIKALDRACHDLLIQKSMRRGCKGV